jgi:predicted oxidoreductase
VKTFRTPLCGLDVPSVILGLMRLPGLSQAAIRALYDAARDCGITFFDHADIYGRHRHDCEALFADALRLTPAQRGEIVLQSKVGIRKGFFDFSRAHILATVDESLAALRTDYLDVLLLHRPDTLVEPDEVAAAFDALHDAGKVRHFGVSNQHPGQVELLKSAVRQPLVFNQVQFSLTHAALVSQGIAVNMEGVDQSVSRDVGLLDYSRLQGMTLQAWSPFQKRFFDGTFLGDRETHAELNDALDRIAAAHGVTPTGIAVAWIVRHPANIQVVLGTTQPQRVRDCAAGADVVLSREEWYALYRAAGHRLP